MTINKEIKELQSLTLEMTSMAEDNHLQTALLNKILDKDEQKKKVEKQVRVKAPHRDTLFMQNSKYIICLTNLVLVGSVPYGLPCLAVTRRTGNSSTII